MATIFSSHTETAISQPAHRIIKSPVLQTKRSILESYYSSYGESEVTPTPKPCKTPRPYSYASYPYSYASHNSESCHPTIYGTPPSAQTPRLPALEESGDESDQVYDQFDLGDFTKEEIKIYESMLGPGERLRDAAPPEKSLAEMLEASYQTGPNYSGQHTKGPTSIRELPEELYELVRAGISNAIHRAISDKMIIGYDSTVEDLKMVFMNEISGPSPQINHFIRNHPFPCFSTLAPQTRRDARRRSGYPSGYLKSEQRQYEQDVYDFSRNLDLPMDRAERWALKARDFWSEKDYDGMDTEESGDFSNRDETLDQTSNVLSPEIFSLYLEPVKHVDQAPDDSTSDGLQAKPSREIEDNVPLTSKHETGGAKPLEQGELRILKHSDRRFKDNRYIAATPTSPILRDELSADNVVGHNREINRAETVVKEGEKADKRAAKAARKAQLKVEKLATRLVEKSKRQKGEDEQIANPERQAKTTNISEEASKLEQLKGNNKPQLQERKGRKHERDQEPPPQSEVVSGEHHQHKRSRVDSGRQDVTSRNPKTTKGGPQYSPFFQRNSVIEAEKGVNKTAKTVMDIHCSGPKATKKDAAMNEAKIPMDFRSPMIQPPPEYPPSTPVQNATPMVLTSPPSDCSSPLSSLRSTPSLLSFGNEEIRRDNERLKQLSHGCARSKLVTPILKLPDDCTGLPTPASTAISLRELNKRILEGTIYQDYLVFAKPEAPATLVVPKKARKRSVTVSRFFAKSLFKKPKAHEKVSCIPFPPLHATSFGLVQERLCHDPFRLLIAVIFLNKTRGSVALPVFYQLMERFPTPADLAAAKQEDVVEIIQHLGLQNQRAKKCINLAKAWLERPPVKGKRYRVLHYPKKDDGKDVGSDEILSAEDERVAWEIGQLPGIGVYAIDSWRIFCRDELRGSPSGLPRGLTPEAQEAELQKEWTRVLAGDKELRAYLRWRWLRNGWDWDPVTGERKKADEAELAKAERGGVIYEGDGGDMVVGNVKVEEGC